jgi:hypothetical protein
MMNLAQENGMLFCDLVDMPANNISLVFTKS